MDMQRNPRPRIVIIGAGFGGLSVALKLAKAPVEVLLLDRNNYHGFWPLLYQVATAELEPQQIAKPVRELIRHLPNMRSRLATVQAIDRDRQMVHTDRGSFPYDYLVVAPGSTSNFFGLQQLEAHSYQLKDIPDALTLRNHLIACFEQAVTETDPERIQRLQTFVVVGGGPTGVELAGAIAELIRHVLQKDYRAIDFNEVRVVLVEMADRILLPFTPSLSQKAQQALTKLGVELRLQTSVVGYENNVLHFKDGSTLPTDTVIWAAGVQASPLGKTLGVPLQRGGRVAVTPELHLPDDPNVWVIGDLAHVEGPDGKPYPMLATVAMQQGRHVARNILRKLRGEPLKPFRYVDKGSMATIGRHAAVAQIWNLSWSGFTAWVLWLGVHIWYLIGIRNRILVLVNWAYSYFTYEYANRAIFAAAPDPAAEVTSRQLVEQSTQVGELSRS